MHNRHTVYFGWITLKHTACRFDDPYLKGLDFPTSGYFTRSRWGNKKKKPMKIGPSESDSCRSKHTHRRVKEAAKKNTNRYYGKSIMNQLIKSCVLGSDDIKMEWKYRVCTKKNKIVWLVLQQVRGDIRTSKIEMTGGFLFCQNILVVENSQ